MKNLIYEIDKNIKQIMKQGLNDGFSLYEINFLIDLETISLMNKYGKSPLEASP